MRRTQLEERYQVIFQRDSSTGVVVSEEWLEDDSRRPATASGSFHRTDGPALIIRDPVTGIAVYEGWYQHDEPHREGGPAGTKRDPKTGNVVKEEWYQHGNRHRLDGPAITNYNPTTGEVTTTSWRIEGKPVPEAQRPRTGARRKTAPGP